MLELRPIYEHCATALPPDSVESCICSFQCTFCRSWPEDLLDNICPHCGGGFVRHRIRHRPSGTTARLTWSVRDDSLIGWARWRQNAAR